VSSTSAPTVRGLPNSRQAIERLRELVSGGDFLAAIAVDRKSGELLSPEARAMFAALPAITPATTMEELVDLGLLHSLPHGLRRAREEPRYRAGRELFVRTSVSHRQIERVRPVGYFSAVAPLAFTHRALLRGQSGDALLVELEGAPTLLSFARTDVFAWNEPTLIATGCTLSGVTVDYDDGLLKAHIAAAFIDIADELGKLDLSGDATQAAAMQAQLLHRVASRVRMSYAGHGEGYAGSRAGALLHGGQGVCFVQRAVAAALLAPFARPLAFDLQVGNGRTLRLGATHGFLIVTLRPSLARYVVDPAWGEPLTDLRVAFFGPSWGHDRRLDGFEGSADTRVDALAINLPEVQALS
jgi:hypothetical protein